MALSGDAISERRTVAGKCDLQRGDSGNPGDEAPMSSDGRNVRERRSSRGQPEPFRSTVVK